MLRLIPLRSLEIRGPKAARIYAEAREAYLSPSDGATQQDQPDKEQSASAFAPNPYQQPDAGGVTSTSGKQRKQEILVLQDGFENFQALYRVRPVHLFMPNSKLIALVAFRVRFVAPTLCIAPFSPITFRLSS